VLSDCRARTTSSSNLTTTTGNECHSSSMDTDLECVLRKTESDKKDASSYAYQRHEAFSIGYYVRCAYDDTLSSYYFRRDEGCIIWFAQFNDLAHRVKNIVFANVPMEKLSKQQWEAYCSATRCHICEKPRRIIRESAIIVISLIGTAVQCIQIVT